MNFKLIGLFVAFVLFSPILNSFAEEVILDTDTNFKPGEVVEISGEITDGIPGQISAIEIKNPNGETIKLSSLKGKLVLLDFWASWCKPCRMENPNVVRMYNKYKDKGFEVFSFSLDKDLSRWKNAIKQDGLIWPNHASDLKGWNTATIPMYGFNGIPFTVLIDKDGKIIETNLRGPALENKLISLLG